MTERKIEKQQEKRLEKGWVRERWKAEERKKQKESQAKRKGRDGKKGIKNRITENKENSEIKTCNEKWENEK